MTREEAIEYNKNLKEYMKITDKKSEYKFLQENYEALDIAIKALEEPTYYPPCIDCNKKMDEIRRAYDKLKEQEPIDKSAMMYDIYMEGVNMSGEYQGCWVRFKDIEKIVDKYIGSEE